MSGPLVYDDASTKDPAVYIRNYFIGLGAELQREKNPDHDQDLRELIEACGCCFTHGPEQEVERVLTGIVSLLITSNSENTSNLIYTMSEKLSKAKLENIALRLVWLLFQHLKNNSPIKYDVYFHLVKIAKEGDQVRLIFPGLEELKKWFAGAPPTAEQMQKLLRLLHEVLVNCKESELAAKVMLDLLGTYTNDNAADAREDAKRCILTAIADPETFLLDPLLTLKPVRVLKNELIYGLLEIFVSGKLSDYLAFHNQNKNFVKDMGLNHEANLKKMRLLTFMQLAEGVSEMSFDTITAELQIDENEVEAFVINILKTKLVRGRMDQSARKILTRPKRRKRSIYNKALKDELRTTLSSLTIIQASEEDEDI